VNAADRWSVRGAGRTRAGQGAVVRQHHRRHHTVIPEPARYKRSSYFSPSAPSPPLQSAAPRRRGRRRQTAASLHLQATARASEPLRTRRTSLGRAWSTLSRVLAGARAPAARAGRHRRPPSLEPRPCRLTSPINPR
jgi:hypothetical protein